MTDETIPSGFSIGKVKLKYGLMLAPLAGVSDHPFRRICREAGAEYAVSEMVSAKSLCYEKRSAKASVAERSKTAPLAAVWEDDNPMAVQIFGSEPTYMAEAAAMLEAGDYAGCVSARTPDAIDINMGCPVQKVTGNGEGSALLRNIPLAAAIVRAVKRAVCLPVTVKIRIGWDAETICDVEMARALEDAGADAICVHGRTREQLYRPGVRLDRIAAVKESVRIPVIGNGDVTCAADAWEMRRVTGCDGIMIARGAMGNPWIFSEIIAAWEKRPFTPPTLRLRVETALGQMHQMVAEKGERIGFSESKKQMAWYLTGMRGAAQARGLLMTAANPARAEEILTALVENEKSGENRELM